MTSDPNIVSVISFTKTEIEGEITQTSKPKPYEFSHAKAILIDNEIQKMPSKKVLKVTDDSTGFGSNIFTRDKADGSLRVILYLSQFNKHVVYRHFKMENLSHSINLTSQDYFMASIGYKDSCYSVPIAIEHQKF